MYGLPRQIGRADVVALPSLRLWWFAALLFALLALFTPVRSSADQAGNDDEALPDLARVEQAFEHVIEQVSPSVVGIKVQRRYFAALPGDGSDARGVCEQLVTVNGSGTVIDPRGMILTNEHVIQSAGDIEVVLHDGQVMSATVVAADARSDLAVLKVKREDLPPVPVADWSGVTRGQWTITLGNPYGLGANDGKLSASVGVIANLDRALGGLGEVDDRLYADMIETTAAIHPGCSGGPLFNIRGELVGVVTAMHTRAVDDEGVGFAIPMTPARCRLIHELCAGRPIVYGYIGLDVRALEPAEREVAGLDGRVGAVVKRVDPDGPAAEADVREGDLVLRFNQQLVEGPGSLAALVGQAAPGQTISLELRRGTQSLTVQATLTSRQVSRVSWMRGGALVWRGMRLTDLTPLVRERMNVGSDSMGVVVIDVAENSPAQHAAVQIGDVIDGVANASVQDIAAFRRRVEDQQGPVRIRVRTRGELVVGP
jgi:S1-C subfamily serine protease